MMMQTPPPTNKGRCSRREEGDDAAPLLRGCRSSDASSPEEPPPSRAPDSVAEEWLLRGGKARTSANTTSRTPSPKSSPSRSQQPPSPWGRGRSPCRPLFTPEPWESPELQLRKTRSLEPPKRSSPAKDTKPIQNAVAAAGSPIPDEYVDYIVTAFGADADLYKDVLGMEERDCAPTKLRVAYFRRGREVLRNHASGSPVSVADGSVVGATATTTAAVVSPKKRFQAVTKAYEILTNPGWKAYYEVHGLVAPSVVRPRDENADFISDCPLELMDDNEQALQQQEEEEECEHDDIASIASGGSVSILRRSHSWGGGYHPNNNNNNNNGQQRPSSSRSTSRTRVCWREVVEELVYQPDVLDTSGDSSSSQVYHEAAQSLDDSVGGGSVVVAAEAADAKHKKAKFLFVLDSPELDEELGKLEKRDFLDDLEASMDGLEQKIGGFINYALSDVKDATNFRSTEKDQNVHTGTTDERKPPAQCENSDESSFKARQLFADLTEPSPQIESSTYTRRLPKGNKRRGSLAQDGGGSAVVTTTAPLKQGNIDQPRVKPKKTVKHKKRGDTNMVSNTPGDDFYSVAAQVFFDARTGDSKQVTHEGSRIWNVPEAVKAMANFWNVGGDTGESAGNPTAVSKTLLDYYELQADSSILASVASVGDTSTESERKVEKSGFAFGVPKTWSFDDACLKTSTEGTTMGSVRPDHHNGQLSDSRMDASDATFTSKASDNQSMGRNLNECLNNFATAAQDTIREVTSFDETDKTAHTTTPPTQSAINSGVPDNQKAMAGSSDGTFMSAVTGCVQLLVEDMNKLGTRISTNLGEANRVVVATMSFPEAEVDGMLSVLESELNCPNGSKDWLLNKSFTF